MHKAISLLVFSGSIFVCGAFAACGGSTVNGQGSGCAQDSDCPSGNGLKCVPFRNAAGGSCQIPCDPSKTGSCPANETCGELPNVLPAVCKVSPSNGSGGGKASTSTATGTSGG